MNGHSEQPPDFDDLRKRIIGLGDDSHTKSYYSAFRRSRSESERFRAIIDQIPDMIIVLDEDLNIVDLNRAAEELLGEGPWKGRPLSEAFPNVPATADLVTFEGFGGPPVVREMEFREAQAGNRTYQVLMGRDVSHRLAAEAELERQVQERTAEIQQRMEELERTQAQLVSAEKLAALGELVAGVTHDMNTPLGIGITAASGLQDRTNEIQRSVETARLTATQFRAFLEYQGEASRLIFNNLERAAALVRSFKRVAVDQQVLDHQRVRFREYLDDILANLRPALRRHHVEVAGDEALKMTTVPGAWSQIIGNLVQNSLKHGFEEGEEEGTIRITFAREDSRFVLRYRDSGKGLTDEARAKIFHAFFTTAGDRGGTGLGMHIVNNLVHYTLDGSIAVDDSDDGGAGFVIDIPLHD